ncbi:MAG: class I adenylate-forming enzyme family protein [Promethearchaeota archaeon]
MVEIPKKDGVAQCTLELFEDTYGDRHLVHGVVAKWAKEKPNAIAIIDAEDGREVSWAEFDQSTTAVALKLLDMGFEKGDIFVSTLPLLVEHIFIEYACFKIGVLFVPLDLRLKPPEVIRSVKILGDRVKAYAFLGKVTVAGNEVDFGPLGAAVKQNCPNVEYLVQFCKPDEAVEGAVSIYDLGAQAKELALAELGKGPAKSELLQKFGAVSASITENDGCLVIYTTGSTGLPKPALLSHRGITCQNMCLAHGFGMDEEERMLVNLPPSHVGCQTEQMMTPWFMGGTDVILHVFDPAKSLQAIQDYKVSAFGQIPALFALEWRLPNYDEYDLSSLKFALYGGQAVTRQFLEKLSTMAEKFGSGMGLTETSGFCTYTPLDGTVDDILAGLGHDMPVYPMTIRAPMNEDGSAGDELPDGEIGELCYKGPQTFLRYINNPEATKKTISTDGWLYSGDLGYKDEKGLHLSGRAKFVIKPKGYQVFPPQVEDALASFDGVVNAAVIGIQHDVFSEGIVALVEVKPDAAVTEADLKAHMKEAVAAYMRPLLYVFLKPGEIPLNRVAKTDYLECKKIAQQAVDEARAAGGWDKA